MEARVLTILDRQRKGASYVADVSDFSLEETDTVRADIVLQPHFSLYCLDAKRREALFVDLPLETNLAQVPFVYQTQFDLAKRLIAVPYETFTELAQSLPDPSHLILIHSTGRCGSTLLHSALNELENTASFSESDVLSQFIHLRDAGNKQDSDLEQLLRYSVRFVFKPSPFKAPNIHAIKFRNQCVEIMDMFHRLYPQAKNLFLYRNAVDWVRSIYRIASRRRTPPDHNLEQVVEHASNYYNRDMSHFKNLFDEGTQTISAVQQMTLWWLGVMEGYVYWSNQGLPILAWRYEDLNATPEKTLESMFDYCELRRSDVLIALRAFQKDSQENTRFARESDQGNSMTLSQDYLEQIRILLAKHPVIHNSNFTAPNTQLPY